MQLDILIDMKLLLCSATSPRIALAILAKQSADFAFLYRFFYIVIAMEAAAVSLFLPLLFLRYKWSAKEIYGMAVAVVFFADRVSDPDFQYV